MKVAGYEVHPAAGMEAERGMRGICLDPQAIIQIAPCSTAPGFAWISIVRDGEEQWQERPVRLGSLGALLSGLGFRDIEWKSYEAVASAICPFGKKPNADTQEIYFAQQIGGVGPIKIGWSRSPNGRLESLQIGSPVLLEILGTEPGGRDLERGLHCQFAHLRLHGEWFRAEPELLQRITAGRGTP